MSETKISKFDQSVVRGGTRPMGMLYGVLLGDVLGTPLEFAKRGTPKVPYTGLINMEHTITIQFQFSKTIIPPASVSDDSIMTLALLRALVNNNMKYDPDKVALEYMVFANNIGTGMGKHTRALFKGVKTVRGYKSRYNKMREAGTLEGVQSNGSLMRCSPLALLDSNHDDYALTNPNPVNRDCGEAYVGCLRMLLDGKNKKEVSEWLMKQSYVDEVSDIIKESFNDFDRDVSGKTKGWVLNSLYVALYSFWHFSRMEEAMKFICCIPDSDTDTNAAIAGALFGAVLGLSGMKEEESTAKNIEMLNTLTPESKELNELLKRVPPRATD